MERYVERQKTWTSVLAPPACSPALCKLKPLKSKQVEQDTLQGPLSYNIQEFQKCLENVPITLQIRVLVQCGCC